MRHPIHVKRLNHCSVLNIEIVIDQSALLHIHVIDCIGTLLLLILIGFDHLIGQWLAMAFAQRLTLARAAPEPPFHLSVINVALRV